MNFRPMRRGNQELPISESREILERGSYGVLSLRGDGGYPYGVPLNYLYHQGKLYFHCAKDGHKADAVRRCDKASFCVVSQSEVMAESYSTAYRSAVVFGRIRVMGDGAEKRRIIRLLTEKYAPNQSAEENEKEIERFWTALCILEMEAEHLTGKEALSLSRDRKKTKEGSL